MTIGSSPSSTASAVTTPGEPSVLVARKALDLVEQQGRDAVALIESAAAAGKGALVDRVA